MGYSIGQAAKRIGLTAHTLRYYDKEGLLPFVKKTSSGLRVFSDADLEWLMIIECLKGCGMQLKDIKQYIDWCRDGNSTINKRLELLKLQKIRLAEQQARLSKHMEKIDFKIAFYEDAALHGDLNVFERNKLLADEKERIFGSCCAANKNPLKKN